jgi:VWFA-related protein
MKLSVAFLLVLTVFGSAAVAQRQPQRQKSAVGKPPGETIRICQGLPIPDGYVIIAYMTSSACSHGAYLLKKQANYESSLTVNGARQSADESAAPSNTPANSSRTAPQPTRTFPRTSGKSAPSAGKSTDTRAAPPQTRGNSAQPAQSASITRPRRVGSSEPAAGTSTGTGTRPEPEPVAGPAAGSAEEQAAGPPTLIGSQTARALRPPTLGNAGAVSQTSMGEPSSSNVVSDPGPEEVDEGDVVRVNTNLVAVPVSVLDRQGRFVPNLRREDFSLFENGIEQSIAYFEPAEKPFTVALVLDTSASTHFHLSEIREAAIAFARQLRPQDRVLVVSFNDQVLLLTEATNDLNIVETVIEENANTGNSTRLYDAMDLTIRERLNKIKGRKAIVLFTDGVDTSSQQATYQGTLREVEELDALIYPIQYDTSEYMRAMQGAGNGIVTVTTTRRGLFGSSTSTQTYGVPANGGAALPGSTKADYDRADQYLHALADKTGGRLYQANDTQQLGEAFTRIAEELRRQYSLGYYPKTDNTDGNERREIRVRVRQANLAVKARDSYLKSTNPNK